MPQRSSPRRVPTQQSSVFPPVIKNLLILNGLFFFAQFVAESTSTRWMAEVLNAMALYPPGAAEAFASGVYGGVPTIFGRADPGAFWSPGFQPWQVVTYAFLHGDFFHIAINMYILWMFGQEIEQQWGSRRFGIFFFFCVLGAALAQILVRWGQPVPTLGASGGVFGILLAFGMMFPERRIMLLFPPIPLKAKWFVIGLGAMELFAGVTGTQSGVANFAHLGGAIAGFLLIQYWRGRLPVEPSGGGMRW